MKNIKLILACLILYVVSATAVPVLAVNESPPLAVPVVARSVESAERFMVENATVSAYMADNTPKKTIEPEHITLTRIGIMVIKHVDSDYG